MNFGAGEGEREGGREHCIHVCIVAWQGSIPEPGISPPIHRRTVSH